MVIAASTLLGRSLPSGDAACNFSGVFADHLKVDRRARLHLGTRGAQLRHRRRTRGVGLRDVGAGALADFEARARRTRLLGQELQVLLGQDGDLTVANDIHVGRGGVEQDVLFGVAQALLRGAHMRLGGFDVVPGLKAVEQASG